MYRLGSFAAILHSQYDNLKRRFSGPTLEIKAKNAKSMGKSRKWFLQQQMEVLMQWKQKCSRSSFDGANGVKYYPVSNISSLTKIHQLVPFKKVLSSKTPAHIIFLGDPGHWKTRIYRSL